MQLLIFSCQTLRELTHLENHRLIIGCRVTGFRYLKVYKTEWWFQRFDMLCWEIFALFRRSPVASWFPGLNNCIIVFVRVWSISRSLWEDVLSLGFTKQHGEYLSVSLVHVFWNEPYMCTCAHLYSWYWTMTQFWSFCLYTPQHWILDKTIKM